MALGMKRRILWTAGLVAALAAAAGSAQEEARIRGEQMLRALVDAAAHFEANLGQLSPGTDFAFRTDDYLLELSRQGIGLELAGNQMVLGPPMQIQFMNTPGTASAHGLGELPFGLMQRVSRDGVRRHLTRVPAFRSVKYPDMYTGIDVQYYLQGGRLEYDMVVAPHANPSQIALNVQGARESDVDPEGNLRVSFPVADLVQHKPRVYQLIEGRRVEVDGRDRVQEDHRVTIEVGAYDANHPLVIDPVISLKAKDSKYGLLNY